jgi:phage terminase large subunit
MGAADLALWRATRAAHDLYPHLAAAPPPTPQELPAPLLRLPRKLERMFHKSRYKIVKGGRGGAKSWGFAKILLTMGAERELRILCARELQVSITESVHKLLSDQVAADPWLSLVYDVQKTSIRNIITGTEFIFAGIRNNVTKIKSMEGIDICWVEEAEKVSDYSWQVLIPTIRKPGSEIWISFNPDEETDPTSRRFIQNVPPNSIVIDIGWQDNPWFPEELRAEKDYLYKIDPEAADHVWGGQYRKNSAAQIFRGRYKIEAFVPEPDWDGPYFGADFGFSVDPSTLVKVFIHNNRLYISEEAYAHGVETDEMPAFYEGGTTKKGHTFPGVTGSKKRPIRADSARPETISYLQRHGYGNVIGAQKWPGSVEDGIEFLKSFECIVIHTRCKHAQEEARLYAYKVDRLTKEPTTDVDDKHNHIWDAVRYALEPLLRQKNMGMLNYMKQLAGKGS